ncbi:MAG: FN3 associated domain-containing protein, partial [Verrucomicrobiales bacterium]|nr:FN3 associated domain-containing protein [Verrucomicrobiales bacterium]
MKNVRRNRPRRAAYWVLIWAMTCWGCAVVTGEFRVTEFQAVGEGVLVDEDGDRPDWIEVRNGSVEPASLAGWSLTDDREAWAMWVFPDVLIGPGESLVVFASGKDRATAGSELHTNFRLAAGGGYLGLSDPGGRVVSASTDYPKLPDGYSLGEKEGSENRGLVFFAEPTPGERNLTEGVEGFLDAVVFGRRHGFHETPFQLELSSEGGSIWYTTDGSVPGSGSGVEYTGAIEIDGTTVVRAVAERVGYLPSPVVTQSYIDLEDVVQQAADGRAPAGWPARAVNGQQFYYQMHPQLVARVGEERVVEALRALPSLSLVTPLEHLVDGRTGIYVNAERRGREWERPGSIELLDPEGGEGFEAGCGVRVRGGISRSDDNPKHSFRLLFRS